MWRSATELYGKYWQNAVLNDAYSTGRLRAARTALTVERYRLAKGSLPEISADLVPEFMAVPLEDPFDGAPLRYKKLPKGFAVYSVGKNGKDDGGPPGTSDDVVFAVKRPEPGKR